MTTKSRTALSLEPPKKETPSRQAQVFGGGVARLNIELTAEQHKAVKLAALQQGIHMRDLVVQALQVHGVI
jgi:predicted HicB family RNase H-like nuclease